MQSAFTNIWMHTRRTVKMMGYTICSSCTTNWNFLEKYLIEFLVLKKRKYLWFYVNWRNMFPKKYINIFS